MLADAQVLLQAGRAANAYYLAGYSVEMALKAVIARRFLAEDIPDPKLVASLHTYDLTLLARLAGVRSGIEAGSVALRAYWVTVQDWSPRSRYESASPAQAADLLEAVGARRDGVLAWLATIW